MADFEKKFAQHRMGPGGLSCPCCGPAPGKYRREFLRAAKHAAKQVIEREIDTEIEDWFDWYRNSNLEK